MRTALGLLALTACFPFAVFAQTSGDTIALPDIVVSADRAPRDAARTGSTVEVLGEGTIEARPFLRDTLRDLPGLSANQTGPAGTVSGFTLRGAPQQYVRVYVDGIEISDPTGTQVAPSLSGLLADDVGRLEVLKGSQSALYGGQAVGGVIDIATRLPARDGIAQRYRLEAGERDTQLGAYTLAGRGARGGIAASLVRFRTDGFSAAEERDGNDEDDGYEATRASLAGRLYLTDRLTGFAAGFYQTEDGEFDAGPGPGQDAPNTFQSDTWGAIAGLELATAFGLENRLAVSRYRIERDSTSFFGGVPSPFNTEGTRDRVEYLGLYRLSDRLALQFGADWTIESTESNFSGGEQENRVLGGFGQAIWTPGERLTINTAIRQDDHSQLGGYTTGRLTAAYLPAPATTLRGSLGTGFRAPSNFELFDAFSGNPDLDPETSLSADLGVEQRFAGDRGSLSATVFYLEIEDLIDFDPATSSFVQTDGTSTSRGLELAAAWDLTDRLALEGAYTYTDAELADGSRRNRVPRHALGLALDSRPTERLNLGLGARLAAGVVDDSAPLAPGQFDGIEDYVVVDARLGYRLTEAAELYVRAENLFDADYQTARGFSTPGRAFFAGVTGRF